MKIAVAIGVAVVMAGGAMLAQSGPHPSGVGDFMNDLSKKPTPADFQKALEEQNKQVDRAKTGAEAEKKAIDAPGKALKQGSDLFKKLKDFNELNEAFDKMSPTDGPWDPEYTPPGTPEVPTSCAPNSECGPCYEKAYGDLTAVRIRLEKLRVLYGSTQAWVTKALAFGDGASGVSGYAALAWQTERRKIEGSVKNLESSYDAKYDELMEVLQEALNEISACEASFHNNPDWYNRFGYMFHTFMADRYKR